MSLVIPHVLLQVDGASFVLHNSGPGSERIMIFGTHDNMRYRLFLGVAAFFGRQKKYVYILASRCHVLGGRACLDGVACVRTVGNRRAANKAKRISKTIRA